MFSSFLDVRPIGIERGESQKGAKMLTGRVRVGFSFDEQRAREIREFSQVFWTFFR
jgi:hypothetical protein